MNKWFHCLNIHDCNNFYALVEQGSPKIKVIVICCCVFIQHWTC